MLKKGMIWNLQVIWMLNNIEDWKSFFHSVKFDVLYQGSFIGIKERLGFLWACIQDLVLYGGMTCNRHGKFLCKKCYSKEFIKKEKERQKEFDDWPMTDTGGTNMGGF